MTATADLLPATHSGPNPQHTYPQAVARVVATIGDGDREKLRGLVAWVLDYDRHDRSPATAGTSPKGAP